MHSATPQAMCLVSKWGFDKMSSAPVPDAGLQADYFDGKTALAHPVTLFLQSRTLLIRGQGFEREVPVSEVRWPERSRYAVRIAHLKQGGAVQCADASGWEKWCQQGGISEPLVVKMQQSWRGVAAAAAALAVVLFLMQQWVLPWTARAVVAVTPVQVDAALGEAALNFVDQHLMMPSRLTNSEQERLRLDFERLVGGSPKSEVPAWSLVFRRSKVGPNALALPGGTLIMTDELVALLENDAPLISGVLAHELGHVQHRHGLRMLVQTTVLSAAAAAAFGDFSPVFAAVPVWLGQAGYSRDAEREADAAAARMLMAAERSPLLMVTVFDQLSAYRAQKQSEQAGSAGSVEKGGGSSGLGGIAFASHPAERERAEFFRQAATQP
jgi:Zn-dependent protease with chaperone function